MSYRLTPLARDDLREIARYTARTWGTEQSRRYRDTLTGCMEKLVHGEAHVRAAPFDAGLLRSRCAGHVLWFRRSGDDVEIAILHPSMDHQAKLTGRMGTRQ